MWPDGPDRIDLGGVGADRVDPARVDPSRVDPSRVDPSRVDPSRADLSRAGADLVGADLVGADRIGPYRLVQQLGEGGMGVVHLAVDQNGRAVAIKVLRAHIAHDREARTRLDREVQTLARVQDARVATVLDADTTGPRPYIVTRYVPGPPLDRVVAEHGPLAGEPLLRLARGLSGALSAIHAAGVVHRDLKPGNVLLLDGDPVVIDFGIAHVADDVRLTMTGLVMGTPGYLSPEVVEGAPVTEATDWWGWAATLAFAAGGAPPFGRGPMNVVLDRVRRGRPNLVGIDPRLVPLLRAALSPDAAGRPHADEIIDALDRYAAGGRASVAFPVTAPVSAPAARTIPVGAPAARTMPVGPPAARTTPVGPPGAPTTPVGPPGAPTAPVGPPVAPTAPFAPPRTTIWADDPAPRPGDGPDPMLSDGSVEGWPAPEPAGAPASEIGPSSYGRELRRGEADADWRSGGDRAPGQPDPRRGRPARTGTLLAMLVAVVGTIAVWPVVGAALVVLWCWAARFADRSVSSLVVRRYEKGRRRRDVPIAVVASPWHLLSSAIATVVGLLLPVLVAAASTFSAALAIVAVTGGTPQPDRSGALAAGGLIGLLMAWWGPGGVSLHRGSRSLVRGVAPGSRASQVVVVALVLLGAGLGLWAWSRHGQPDWWPWTVDQLPLLRGMRPG